MNKEQQIKSLNALKEYIGENGLLPFEHGFRRPTFQFEGYKYVVSMISDKLVYCRKIIPFGQNRNANLPLRNLPAKTLDKLLKVCHKYEEYCQTEA